MKQVGIENVPAVVASLRQPDTTAKEPAGLPEEPARITAMRIMNIAASKAPDARFSKDRTEVRKEILDYIDTLRAHAKQRIAELKDAVLVERNALLTAVLATERAEQRAEHLQAENAKLAAALNEVLQSEFMRVMLKHHAEALAIAERGKP